MSKRTHQKELERARSRRREGKLERRKRRTRIVALVLAFMLAASVFAVALLERGGSPTVEDDPDAETDESAAPDGEACPSPDDAPEPSPQEYDESPESTIDEDATYVATLDTTCGELLLELDPQAAPRAVNSFVFLAEDGYFEGVPFHRVVPGFVVQGGDPTGTGTGGPGYAFDDELETAEQLVAEHGGYPRGTLAMANAGPDTNGSQFFVTLEDPVDLPPDYTAFGEVLDGMDVVDQIAQQPADGDQALDPVRIRSVSVDEG